MNEEIIIDTSVTFVFNGEDIVARSNQMLAAAILENGERILRRSRIYEEPRGLFCGIGICFDCLVTVDDVPNQRACLVRVSQGLIVRSQ
jgi:hypothetical protein